MHFMNATEQGRTHKKEGKTYMIIKDCEMTKNELDRAINKVLFGAHGNWKGWKQLILLSQCGKMELKVAPMDYWQGDYDKVCDLTLDMDPERSYIFTINDEEVTRSKVMEKAWKIYSNENSCCRTHL